MQCNAYQGNVGSGTCHLTGQRILYLYFQFNFKTQQDSKKDKSGNSKSIIIYFYIRVFFPLMFMENVFYNKIPDLSEFDKQARFLMP